jgi:hypothetical protein
MSIFRSIGESTNLINKDDVWTIVEDKINKAEFERGI